MLYACSLHAHGTLVTYAVDAMSAKDRQMWFMPSMQKCFMPSRLSQAHVVWFMPSVQVWFMPSVQKTASVMYAIGAKDR
eukprot:6841778-Lingulodinium_polyedra.AAC.1